MANFPQYDNKYMPPKEVIRKKIKQALRSKNAKTFTSLDANADILVPIDDVVTEFRMNYKMAGGKHILCTKENFADMLVHLIENQHYPTILNTAKALSPLLAKHNIHCYDSIDSSSPVDAAIVFANQLIARNGAMVFSQKLSLYPSVKNLAKDIIVVAMVQNIVPDLKTVLDQYQPTGNGKPHDMLEIITPTNTPIVDGKNVYTPNEPRYIMLLVE